MILHRTKHIEYVQGNVLAVYERRSYEDGSEELYLTEQHIYGSARLGMRKPNLLLAKSDEDVETDLTMSSRALGEKRYELTNHLGNVLAVVSDKRNGDEPDIVSVSKLRISLENQRKQNFLTDFLVFSRKSEYSF